jgi:hypothetical protein
VYRPIKIIVLLRIINRPFSYLFPINGFPHTMAVIDIKGAFYDELVKNPSAEGQPIGFDDVENFPRNFDWRDDEAATITYVQALDKGLGRSKSEFRDAVFQIKLPDLKTISTTSGPPNVSDLKGLMKTGTELFRTQRRLRNIALGQ